MSNRNLWVLALSCLLLAASAALFMQPEPVEQIALAELKQETAAALKAFNDQVSTENEHRPDPYVGKMLTGSDHGQGNWVWTVQNPGGIGGLKEGETCRIAAWQEKVLFVFPNTSDDSETWYATILIGNSASGAPPPNVAMRPKCPRGTISIGREFSLEAKQVTSRILSEAELQELERAAIAKRVASLREEVKEAQRQVDEMTRRKNELARRLQENPGLAALNHQ